MSAPRVADATCYPANGTTPPDRLFLVDRHAVRCAMDDAVTAYLTGLGRSAGLPEVAWSVNTVCPLTLTGQVNDLVHSDPPAVGQAWADALGLTPAPPIVRGCREWSGHADTGDELPIAVTVWAIADREALDEAIRR